MTYLGENRRCGTIMSTYCISIWDKSFFFLNKSKSNVDPCVLVTSYYWTKGPSWSWSYGS